MGPSKSTAISSGVSVKLVVDGALVSELPELTSKLLFVPTLPSSHERVLAGKDALMLLDKNRITFDGRECDKIGVSYSAFRYASDKCNQRVGSCLANQLDDYHEEDMERKRSGESPKFFLEGFGSKQWKTVFGTIEEPDGLTLRMKITEPHISVLSLSLNADSIQFVQQRSPGVFTSIEIEGFESFSRSGDVLVFVQNTGFLSAGYEVGLSACTSGILTISSQTASIAPSDINAFLFQIFSQVFFDREAECTGRLSKSESPSARMECAGLDWEVTGHCCSCT